MMRGNNRQRIFYGEKYFNRFIEIIRQSTETFDHKILAYCLMSNHIHLIVHIKDSPLSTVMQNINFRYARWANYQRKSIGHLFQARYHSINVSDEEYLINLCRYVHLNPVAAKIVDDPLGYHWSSHCCYLSCDSSTWLDINVINDIIIRKTRLNYIDFMSKPVERKKWMPALYYSETGDLITDDTLIKNASTLFDNPKLKKKISADCVANIICETLNIDLEKLYVPCKNHYESKVRALIGDYWIKYSGMTISEIAKCFGRSSQAMHKQISKIKVMSNTYFSLDDLQKINIEMEKRMKSVG